MHQRIGGLTLEVVHSPVCKCLCIQLLIAAAAWEVAAGEAPRIGIDPKLEACITGSICTTGSRSSLSASCNAYYQGAPPPAHRILT